MFSDAAVDCLLYAYSKIQRMVNNRPQQQRILINHKGSMKGGCKQHPASVKEKTYKGHELHQFKVKQILGTCSN
jgi:hypothetical protein